MENSISCEIIQDILPLYVEKLVSEESNKQIRDHIENCECCKQYYAKLTRELEHDSMQKKKNDKNAVDYLKKIYKYQRNNFILGSVVSFLLGVFLPIATVAVRIIKMGEIPDYYIARLQTAWHIGILKCVLFGIVVCVIYMLINYFMKSKVVMKCNDKVKY